MQCPVVIFDGPDLNGLVDSVHSPDMEGAEAAVNLLIARGCQRILFLGMSARDNKTAQDNRSHVLRLRGARRALASHDMPFIAADVYPCDWNYAAAERMAEQLLAQRLDFDGLFCATDVVAIGVLNTLQRHGMRVPDDVAVVGFDGLAESKFVNPTLSTIAIDVRVVAEHCLRLLMDRIHNAPDAHQPRQVTVPFTLVERKSTAR